MENLDRFSIPYPDGCLTEKPYFLLPKMTVIGKKKGYFIQPIPDVEITLTNLFVPEFP
jgi:hypothetical protein